MKTLVIIVTVIGLSAVIGSIIVGKMVFEGKVVDKPYETGLLYDEIEKVRAELRFDILNKRFHLGENEILFTIRDRNNGQIRGPVEDLIVSRPSTSAYDKAYPINPVNDSMYSSKVNFPMQGSWDIKISLRWKDNSVIISKRIYIEKN